MHGRWYENTVSETVLWKLEFARARTGDEFETPEHYYSMNTRMNLAEALNPVIISFGPKTLPQIFSVFLSK